MGKIVCKICGRNDFSSNATLIEHIKAQHMGKLSEESIEYLLKQGMLPDEIIESCRENRVKVDKSKVYKIALRLVREKGKRK